MKTIFITIFQGVEAKNILRTKVFTELMSRPDVRIVFFVRTAERVDYYRQEFNHPRIFYEAVDFRPTGFLDRVFGRLKFYLLRTKTTDLRRRMTLDSGGGRLTYFFGLILNRLLARSSIRRIVRWLDHYFVRERPCAPYFDKYNPDFVFLAHLFDDAETALLREAKRRGIPAVGFINSWDKLTARSALRLLPDKLLVYNSLVKAEALAHSDMPENKIEIVGIPQYDIYFGYRPMERSQFMTNLGLNPQKRIILYCPMGETFSSSDWEIIDLLYQWLCDGTLPPDCELFVRFQPNDRVNPAEVASRPWLCCDRPGTRFSAERGVDWDMSSLEIRHLADTLYHASLLVCYASSISVDAAIFGKPVINIDFEIKPSSRLAKSPTQFYQMEHYQKALRTGGIRLVRSPQELNQWICRYLDNPELDAPARRRLVKEQCGELDAQAGKRISQAIVSMMRRNEKALF